MNIDYEQVFNAFQKYIDRTFSEIRYSDYRREIIEGYYLRNSVSEEYFLKICDCLDNDLYDDYKDMYEPNSFFYGIPLEHYIYELQRLTGKKPSKIRKWNHLKVEAKDSHDSQD